MKLRLETGYIILGHDLGMNVILDRIVLCGKAKSVPSHGIEHIIALHPSLSGYDIQCSVGSGMSYVQSLS